MLSKICSIAFLLLCMGNVTFADRGIGKKAKSKTLLNISNSLSTNSLKTSIALNVKMGLAFKSSIISDKKTVVGGMFENRTLITYQKGNTTYIIPYKQRIAVTEIKQGYTGFKLVIRSKK